MGLQHLRRTALRNDQLGRQLVQHVNQDSGRASRTRLTSAKVGTSASTDTSD